MIYSENELTQIEKYASIYLKISDIAKEKIQIVSADRDYIKKNALVATRRPELVNVELKSVYSERPNDIRNYFGPNFRKVLYEESKKFWNIRQASAGLFSFAELAAMRGEDYSPQPLPSTGDLQIDENRRKVQNKLRLDVGRIDIPIPKDVHFQNELQTLDVANQSARFTRTASEIDRVFLSFIAGYLGSFESKNNPVDKLAVYLLETLADFFGIFDTDAKKVVLYHDNKPKFDCLLRTAIERYKQIRDIKRKKAAAQQLKEFEWSVPEQRLYDDETHKMVPVENQALMPFYELNTASMPEQRFVQFLEQNSDYIDWWYKNCDKGRQHYAVEYEQPDGSKHLSTLTSLSVSKTERLCFSIPRVRAANRLPHISSITRSTPTLPKKMPQAKISLAALSSKMA